MAETPLPHAAPGAPGEPAAFVMPSMLSDLVARARALPEAEIAVHPVGTRLNLRLRDDAAIDRVGGAFGAALPRKACTFTAADGVAALWQGPDEWLLLSGSGERDALRAAVQEAIGDAAASLVDVTERSVTLLVTGPKAALLLNAGCPLDLSDAAFPVGSATRTVLGKSEIVLWRTGETEYRVDVWRSFAPYVFGLLDEARRDFRG